MDLRGEKKKGRKSLNRTIFHGVSRTPVNPPRLSKEKKKEKREKKRGGRRIPYCSFAFAGKAFTVITGYFVQKEGRKKKKGKSS